MKRNPWILGLALAVALAGPALAGGAECASAKAEQAAQTASKKCTHDTQSCLDYMAGKFHNRGWVGVEMDYDEAAGSLTVTAVEPDSPAKSAGLRKGDVLVAMNGIRFSEENREAMGAAQEKMSVGSTVTYTVQRGGNTKEIEVLLAEIPEAVVAKWIGRHMLEHATVEMASANGN